MALRGDAEFHIVDDEDLVREVLVESVSACGYRTRAFRNAGAYLAYFETPEFKPPAGLITDMQMPGMDGFALVRKVRARFPYLCVTLVSGHIGDKTDVLRHVCYYLHKPFKPWELEKVLNAMACCSHNLSADGPTDRVADCDCNLCTDCPFGL